MKAKFIEFLMYKPLIICFVLTAFSILPCILKGRPQNIGAAMGYGILLFPFILMNMITFIVAIIDAVALRSLLSFLLYIPVQFFYAGILICIAVPN